MRASTPLIDEAKARQEQGVMGGENNPVETLEQAQFIASGGLLNRLQQSLMEAGFWAAGIREYMTREDLSFDDCNAFGRVVIQAYGGMRDAQDPYSDDLAEKIIRREFEASGLGDLLGGFGMVVVTTSRSGVLPGEDPAA